jgi:type II protein arginine methyltransferase
VLHSTNEFYIPQMNPPIQKPNFKPQATSLCHGFAGYFHCELYGGMTISIDPLTETTEMISWFPIYFPIKTPINVVKGERIRVAFWRKNNSQKVWYEWAVLGSVDYSKGSGKNSGKIDHSKASGVHNPNGRSYFISK